MKRVAMWCTLLLIGRLLVPAVLSAQGVGGGVVVRVYDSVTPQCVNPKTDRVWFTLRRLITTRTAGWFTEDTAVAVVIKAQVTAVPAPPTGGALSFPLMAEAKFGRAPRGQVSVPIEYTIVSGLPLRDKTTTYMGLGAEVTLVNKRNRNTLGSALDALAAVTASGKLPIPASPYTAGLTYLMKVANDAVDEDIKKSNQDKAVAGSLSFTFDPEGQCEDEGFERTGTKAFVFSEGLPGSGYVDIAHPNDYCWKAELAPAFVLKAAPKLQGKCDNAAYVDVTNNYVGFYLNKQIVSSVLGPSGVADSDREESISRCRANGVIDAKQCPGAE